VAQNRLLMRHDEFNPRTVHHLEPSPSHVCCRGIEDWATGEILAPSAPSSLAAISFYADGPRFLGSIFGVCADPEDKARSHPDRIFPRALYGRWPRRSGFS